MAPNSDQQVTAVVSLAPAEAASAATAAADPIAEFAVAIAERDWLRAGQLQEHLQEAEDARLDSLRDAYARGRQRDVEHVVVSRLPLRLAAWLPNGPFGLGTVRADRGLTIRRDRRDDPLIVGWPREGQGEERVSEMLAEFPILDLQGVEVPNEARPDPVALHHMVDAPIRLLAGSGLAALEPALLARLSTLEELDLRGVDAARTSEFLAALADHPRLRRVICGPRAGGSAADIAHLATLPALEELAIGTGDAPLAPLAGLRGLRHLTMATREVAAADIAALLGGCPDLRTLQGVALTAPPEDVTWPDSQLSELHIELRSPVAMRLLAGHPAVRTLKLTLIANGDEPWNLAGLPMLVEDLTVDCTRLRPFSVGDVAGLAELRALRQLSLIGGVAAGAVVPALVGLPQLERVRFEHAAIADADLVALLANHSLTAIECRNCPQISGAVLPALASSPSLRSVRLDRCAVTEAHLLALAGSGGLNRLALVGSPVFTTASLDHVARWNFRPHLELDPTHLDEAARKRLEDLNRGAISGTVIVTEEVNDF